MSTDREKLREAVAALHAALVETDAVDPETRRLLEESLADIHCTLERPTSRGEEPPASSAAPASMVGRLTTAAEEFEGTHPTLAGLVGSVIDALSRMGI
jgi:hypothetical protein